MRDQSKLLVLDIDNTVFDWVTYYVNSLEALFLKVSSITSHSTCQLAEEARDIFHHHESIEYPFLIQELPSVQRYYGNQIDKMLSEAVEQGRNAFKETAQKFLLPYPGIEQALKKIKISHPQCMTVALTDAPRYVAMWKLNKLGLLSMFDAVYGLHDPKIPTDPKTLQVKVDQAILYKHLNQFNFGFKGHFRVLPSEYEKPGIKGLKTILMDFDMEKNTDRVLWIGDNLRKDVLLGKTLGVHTAWAAYGTNIEQDIRDRLLKFSPAENVQRNVSLDPADPSAPKPDITLQSSLHLADAFDKIFPD